MWFWKKRKGKTACCFALRCLSAGLSSFQCALYAFDPDKKWKIGGSTAAEMEMLFSVIDFHLEEPPPTSPFPA